MQYRRLGRHGLILSALALDFRAAPLADLGRSTLRELLAAVVDRGINYFHTRTAAADTEAQQLLAELIRDLHLPRDQYCLGAQVGAVAADRRWPTQRGLSRKALREFCDQTLRRLDTDYLDLLFCEVEDPSTPLDETLAAIDGLVQQGKILYWGMANWSVTSIAETQRLAVAGQRSAAAAVHWSGLQAIPAEFLELASQQSLGQVVELPWRAGDGMRKALPRWLGQPAISSVVLPLRSESDLDACLSQLVDSD